MNSLEEKKEAFARLLGIIDDLRMACPWDRKQTMESLRHLSIEEVYELGDAILDEDLEEVKKELGDLLMHMVFYSKIGSEKEAFDIGDVLNGVCEKLVERHPHVYGDLNVENEEEVKANWEQIKLKEKGKKEKRSVLEGVPRSLPALVKATRIQDKASGIGFDWDHRGQVVDKIEEELEELRKEVDQDPSASEVEAEFGDALFAMINYGRAIGVDPETALERTNKKFIKRFTYLEEAVNRDGRELKGMSLDEMNDYWEKAKNT